MYLRRLCFIGLLLNLLALASCTANVMAPGVPLEVALASCTSADDPNYMVPGRLVLPASGLRYRIGEVRVVSTNWQDTPQPISTTELRTALRHAIHQSGLAVGQGPSYLPSYILLAQIVSQQREGTYESSREKLVVYYSLIPQNTSDLIMRNVTISTVADIHDWNNDPCARLCELQEKLTRDNIRQMFGELIDSQS